MNMTDKSVIYQAISYFDRYYDKSAQNLNIANAQVYKKQKKEILNPEDNYQKNSNNTEVKILDDLKTYEDFLNLDIKQLCE